MGRKDQAYGRRNLTDWWYRLTVPPAFQDGRSYLQREAAKRGQLVSVVLLFLFCASLAAVPVFLFDTEKSDIFSIAATIACIIGAFFLNRRGKSAVAGMIVAAILCVVIAIDLQLTPLLRSRDLPEFDLLLFSDLAAVSLVSAQSVLLMGGINSAIIWFLLSFHARSSELAQVIAQDSFYAVTSRFIVVQVAIAVVLYLWARTAHRAILRADQADIDVQSQSMLLEQSKSMIKAKHMIDENVERIQRTLSLVEREPSLRIPVSQEDPLWESMLLLNHVLSRLQHARTQERAFLVYQEQVAALARKLALLRTEQETGHLQWTGTTLDAVVAEINALLTAHSTHPHTMPSSTVHRGKQKIGPNRLLHEGEPVPCERRE